MADLKTWTRSFVATAGAILAGPTGAIIGTFLGSLVATILPGQLDFTSQVFSNLGRMSVESLRKKIDNKLLPQDKRRINHDLQTAFRDAIREALYDIGGPDCFPQLAGAPPRDVLPEVIFSMTAPGRNLWFKNNPLAGQVCECLQTIEQALTAQQIFPIDPPDGLPSACVYSYLQAETPQSLTDEFFAQNFSPILKRFPSLINELPELEGHLRRYLSERTLVHLGEHLKQRTPAWRAFNRLVLESIQAELGQVAIGQSEILDRLNALTIPAAESELIAWVDQMAELLTATGTISKQLDDGFEALSNRVISQHREVITRLDELVASSNRIEKKVDRVLRFLSNGNYVIEGEQATIPMPKPPAPGEPPYKGMQYFTEADSDLFFGREQWIARLIARLQKTRFLGVIGASGSGKSSIVRAGVIPVLKGNKDVREVLQKPANSQCWPIWIISPTAHPLSALASTLVDGHSVSEIRDLIGELDRDPHTLDLIARQTAARAQSDHVLLVVDQFEEVFTQCQDEAERAAFINSLMDAAYPEPVGVLVLVIILRADFYSQCAQYNQLRDALAQAQEYIGPMTSAELRLAIAEPAQSKNWKFEPGVIDLMIQDVGQEPGALPLLSHALLETWRNRSGHTMTLESYAESGGVKGAIAKTAEFTFRQRLTPDQQVIAKNIFLRLTNLQEGAQETRRRATLAELTPTPNQAVVTGNVINILADARLITVEEGSIEVAHEALIREWPKLQEWINENRAGLRIHHRLAETAKEWQRMGRDEDLLLQGLRLQEAQDWAQTNPSALNDLERAFLQFSLSHYQHRLAEKEEQQRRELEAAQRLAASERQRAEDQAKSASQLRRREFFLRFALAGAAALAVVAGILAILALNSSTIANQNASTAQIASTKAVNESYTRATAEAGALSQSRLAQIREISARALSLQDRDPDLALLLGAEAVKLAQIYGGQVPQEAGSALYQILSTANYSLTLRGHTDSPTVVQFSADGKKILSAGRDGVAMVWGNDGRRLSILKGHTGAVTAAAFSPDGNRVITASEDNTSMLWNVDGALIQVLAGHKEQVTAAVFSPNGRRILTTSKDGTARLWDENGQNPIILAGHTDAVLAGAFSPDNSLVATTGADQTIRLWRIDGTLEKILTGHTSWVISIQFSPDGTKLLSASWDNTARLWQIDGTLLSTLEGHQSYINSAVFSPDGNLIATGGADNIAKIWSADGKWICDLKGHTQQVSQVLFSPDSYTIATASLDNTIRFWQADGTPLAVLKGHTSFVNSIAFSPDGSNLASSGTDLTIRLWNTNQLVRILKGHYGAATTADFSPDGRFMLTGSTDGLIRLWRKDGLKLFEFYTSGPINHAEISPDGKRILVGLNKNKAIIYDLTGNVINELNGVNGKVLDASYSKNGDYIVTASSDQTAIIWKADGTKLAVLSGHTGPVNTARFNPDSNLVITASEDKTARLWKLDGTPLQPVLTLPDAVGSAVFCPDGTQILTAGWDGNAYLWKMDGTLLSTLKGHTSTIVTAEFSPNGKQIITTSIDATARLWDPSGQLFTILEGHTGWITSAVFSLDSSRILTTSWDGTARIWSSFTSTGQMMDEVSRRVARSLSNPECMTYLYLERCP